MDSIVIGIIVTLIILLVISAVFVQPPSKKEIKEGFVTLNDIMQNMNGASDFLSSLYKSDVEVRNQGTLNCYEYMKSNDQTKNWIEEGMSKRARNRMKVLSTLRTNINHFEDPSSVSTVTMGGCYIPDDVGRTLYNIDGSRGNCTIEDTRNNQSVTLLPSKEGCMIDFTDPQFNNPNKFNKILDVAFQVYDKENIDLIEELKRQIKILEEEIKQLEAAIRANNDQRDHHNREKGKLEEHNSECQTKKRAITNLNQYIEELLNGYRAAMHLLGYYQGLKQEVDSASEGLDEEYRIYSSLK